MLKRQQVNLSTFRGAFIIQKNLTGMSKNYQAEGKEPR